MATPCSCQVRQLLPIVAWPWGLVTAFYAVGATATPVLFVFLIGRGDNALALEVIGAVVLAVPLIAATAVRRGWSVPVKQII